MKITDEVVKELGFVQQNPPQIWDYPVHGKIEYGVNMCRLVKGSYGGQDIWTFHYGKHQPVVVMTVMDMMSMIGYIAHNAGVTETQDKLADALGFSRLADQIADRMARYD